MLYDLRDILHVKNIDIHDIKIIYENYSDFQNTQIFNIILIDLNI